MRPLVKEGRQADLDGRIDDVNRIANESQHGGRKLLRGSRPVAIEAARGVRPAGTPWKRIVDAVERLESGNQTVTFTYSFIPAGTAMEKGKSVELRDHRDGRPDAREFRQEIREALAVWEELFERTFNPAHGYGGSLSLRFVELGDETGTSHASNRATAPYAVPGRENVGDLRFGMEAIGTASPHSPRGRTADGMGDEGGDVHFDSGQDWRTDRDESGGFTSVKIVAAHDGFALPHDEKTSPMALMNPRTIVTNSFHRRFPQGLDFDGSSERAVLVALYGSPASRSPGAPSRTCRRSMPRRSGSAPSRRARRKSAPRRSGGPMRPSGSWTSSGFGFPSDAADAQRSGYRPLRPAQPNVLHRPR